MTQPPPPPPGQPPSPYTGAQPPMSPQDEKLWSTLIHLSPFVLSILGPLIGYLVLKDRGPFVRHHTAQALNFQIVMLIAFVISFVLVFVLVGFVLILALAVLTIVFPIIAAIAANRGDWYRYPMVPQIIS